MKKLLIVLAFSAFMAVAASGQDYGTAIGYRGGYSNGLTFKHFFEPDKAAEALLTSRYKGFNFTGLYEIHQPVFGITGFYWYYGFGGHFGSWHGDPKYKNYDEDRNYRVLGIDGIIGAEYNIGAIPFSISLDYKPGFNITGGSYFWPDEFALSVRYVWGSR